MKYALGNMLNGAGGLNPDGLALDLQFAADKTLTARKGPTPVFTRASTATFIGSDGLIQSAAINAARFDHDPVTLASRGLLIEESRTNLLIRSAELTSTAWTIVNLTGTSVSAPDGTNTAISFSDGVATGEHTIYGSFSPSNRPTTGAVPCTFSCFLKSGTVRYVSVHVTNFTNSVGMLVDTQTWQVVDAKAFGTGWTYTSSKLTDYGSGWYRAELTFTPPAATAVIPRISGTQSSTYSTPSPSYIGTNSTIILWGAQLEVGSFPTSYIPTTTVSVVRSADVCSITGSDFTSFYNQSEGTLFSQTQKTSTGTNTFIAAMSDGTFNNSFDIRYNTLTSAGALMNVSNVGQLTGFSATVTSGALVKQSFAYKLNDCAYSVNGASAIIDTLASIPTVNRTHLGMSYVPSLFLNGHIASIRYYKKRLPNAKLQAITV